MDGPFIWSIAESIPINLVVTHPDTGEALTGQTSYITLTIQRTSDSLYWTGVSWSSALTELTFTEVDATNNPGRYLYTLSAAGNASANKYIVYAHIDNPPTITADSYEIHVSRDLNLNVYSSESV